MSTRNPIMTARDAMLNRLRGRNPETALERDFYCSPEDYQVDLDMIWYRDWLFVGHDCEVLNPGNYLTVQVGDYPIVVLRDRDGGARHGAASGMSVSSMDVRARRPLDCGARHGRRLR